MVNLFKRRKRGQMSIFGLLIVFFEIVIFAAIFPALIQIINTINSTPGASSILVLLVDMFPIMLVISIVLTALVFAGGR